MLRHQFKREDGSQENSWDLSGPPAKEISGSHLQLPVAQTPIRSFQRLDKNSSLYDAYELETVARKLDRALPPERHDSCELQAVTRHLTLFPHPAQANASTDSTTTDLQPPALELALESRTCNGHGIIRDSCELDAINRLIDTPTCCCQPLKGSSEVKNTSIADLLQITPSASESRHANRGTMLYDSYELESITQELNWALYNPPPQRSSTKKCPSMKPDGKQLHFSTLTLIWRLSPWNRGSTLYDSIELKAVAQQLDHAIQNNRRHASPHSHQLIASTYYSGPHLHNLYKENAVPRRVTCPPAFGRPVAAQSTKSTQQTMSWLWKKLKHTFLPNKDK